MNWFQINRTYSAFHYWRSRWGIVYGTFSKIRKSYDDIRFNHTNSILCDSKFFWIIVSSYVPNVPTMYCLYLFLNKNLEKKCKINIVEQLLTINYIIVIIITINSKEVIRNICKIFVQLYILYSYKSTYISKN